MNYEGLADVEAASPFRLPRLHPGSGSTTGIQRRGASIEAARQLRPEPPGRLARTVQQVSAKHGANRGSSEPACAATSQPAPPRRPSCTAPLEAVATVAHDPARARHVAQLLCRRLHPDLRLDDLLFARHRSRVLSLSSLEGVDTESLPACQVKSYLLGIIICS